MLRRLVIRDLVLFQAADADFAPGLNVLTGETGAGKSLLLQALDLALGARADTGLMRTGASQVQVSAEFEALPSAVLAQLEALGIDSDGSLILRRVVSADGKSKAFANDNAITQQALKQIGAWLIQRHGQHDQRGLMDSKLHREMLDAQLEKPSACVQVKDAYRAFSAAVKAHHEVHARLCAAQKEEAYLKLITADLGSLNPRDGEEIELVEARARYMNLQKNQSALTQALEELEGSHPVRSALMAVQKQLARAALDASMQEALLASLERAISEVDEVSASISGALVRPEEDSYSLAAKEDRLFALRAAARKYQVTAEELPAFYQRAKASLRALEDGTAQLNHAEKNVAAARANYVAACETLSAMRKIAGEKLSKHVQKELAALTMADARLRVAQEALPESQWSETGNESVVFEIAPNKGQGFGALNKIASGGELSRLLLAISVVLRGDNNEACVIYDEIDAGTSGAVAEAIGVRLKLLSARQQVIAITHLPQVAASADHHVVIEKHSGKQQAYTTLRSLNAQERAQELARLMSGKVVTEEAKRTAKKMMQAAQ